MLQSTCGFNGYPLAQTNCNNIMPTLRNEGPKTCFLGLPAMCSPKMAGGFIGISGGHRHGKEKHVSSGFGCFRVSAFGKYNVDAKPHIYSSPHVINKFYEYLEKRKVRINIY